MTDMSTIEERLRKHAPATPSRWKEKAEWRQKNKSWLRFSQLVAIRMLEQMAAEGLTQKSLAERLGCSQQYVSKILKGFIKNEFAVAIGRKSTTIRKV